MVNATVAREIIELEHKYWRAIRDGDAEAAMQLTDDECVITGAQGALMIAREHVKDMFASAGWTLDEFELDDKPVVRTIGDDVVVVAYTVTEKLTVEGKPVVLRAADASTWVRRDGRWLCTLHTESVLGDPFGRDRRG